MALVVTNKQAILPGEVVFMLQFTSRFIFGNFQMVSLHFTEVCKCLTVETRVSTFGHCKFQLCDVAIFCFKGNRQHVERRNRMRNMTQKVHVTSLCVGWRKGFV